MNDLNQLLHEAADSGDRGRLDPHELLGAGRRKVRRRRLAVAGGAVAAVVLGAALLTWLPGDDGPEVVDSPRGRSTYEEVRLPVAEVEERCSVVLNDRYLTEDVPYVAGRADDGTAVPGSEVDHEIETREGATVRLLPEGESWSDGSGGPPASRCVIPQAHLLDGTRAAAEEQFTADGDLLLDLCSRRTGFDIGSWDVLVARTDNLGNGLLLAGASNGYVAACELSGALAVSRDEDGASRVDLGPSGNTSLTILPPSALADAGTGHRVEVLLGAEVVASAAVGGAFELSASVSDDDGPASVRLVAADGTEVWRQAL